MLVGTSLAASRYTLGFGGGGGFTQRDWTFTLYAAFRHGPLTLDVVGAAGRLDDDLTRRLTLGPAVRTIGGSASGTNYSLAVEGNWTLGHGTLSHGPFLGLHLQKIHIDGFSESNGGSAALSYASQSRTSAVASLGHGTSYKLGRWRPFARVALERELAGNDRTMEASLQSIPGVTFGLPAARSGRTFGTLSVGVTGKLASRVSSYLAFDGQIGQGNVRRYGVLSGLTLGF